MFTMDFNETHRASAPKKCGNQNVASSTIVVADIEMAAQCQSVDNVDWVVIYMSRQIQVRCRSAPPRDGSIPHVNLGASWRLSLALAFVSVSLHILIEICVF